MATSSIPLLDEAYAYGIVEHPFPLNCCLRVWHLGSDFYQAVKIGIVQYVCPLMSQDMPDNFFCHSFLLLFWFFTPSGIFHGFFFPDDIEDDMCIIGYVFRTFRHLW